MQEAFGGKTPRLRFNELKDEPERDEQQGFMMMFWGPLPACGILEHTDSSRMTRSERWSS